MFLQLLTGLSLLEIVLGVFCNKTLTGLKGRLSSPEDDMILSPKNLHCQYDIYVGAGRAVMLKWTKFELNGKMPSCLENYVEIFIGCGRHSIGRYCSDNSDCKRTFQSQCSLFKVYSSDPCLRIIYHTSDSYDGKGGISADYQAVYYSNAFVIGKDGGFDTYQNGFSSPEKCDRQETASSMGYGNILSPMWPLRSPPSQDCYYRIQTKKSSQKTFRIIFMQFNMPYDDGCHNNTVIVKGGAESQSYSALTAINGPICGNRKPFYLTITAERVWIRFNSRDGARFAIGFFAYEDKSLSAGAVAGIVVSIVVFLAFVGCLFVYLRRRRRRRARKQAELGQATAAAREEIIRRAAARRAAAHHPPPSATRAARNASPRPQQSNTPSSKRQGEQQQTTEATARAVAHHPPPSAPPPPANGSPLAQQSNAPPPEPDYAPPSYIEVIAK